MACEFVSVCLTTFFFIKLVIYKCISSLLIVSATRRREDIKILLCLSAPMRSSLKQEVTTMDARKCNFNILDQKFLFLGKFSQKLSKLSV